MSEKVLVEKILRSVRAAHPTVFCWKTHDMFHAGIPDVVGCLGGVFFGMEVKIKGGRVEKIQSHVISKIKIAGGVAGVVWSVDDARAMMEEVVRKGGLNA